MSALQSHLDNIAVTVTLGALPGSGDALVFNKILIVDSLANSALTGYSPTTVGANASKYAEIAEGDALTSDIGADAQLIISAIFGAQKHPESVFILSADLVGGDTRTTALLALETQLDDYYAVIPVDNGQTVIAEMAAAINQAGIGKKHMVWAGLDSKTAAGAVAGTWDATAIGALSEANAERLFLTYHDGNGTDEADFAEMAALYLSADFDNEAPSANMVLKATGRLTNLTSAEKTNFDTNRINHALPMPGTDVYVDAGVTQSDRPVYHITTRDWLESSLQLAMARLKVAYAGRQMKFPLDSTGQALGLGAITGIYDQGVRAKHLMSDAEIEAQGLDAAVRKALPITAADRAARRLRFQISGYFLEDARKFTLDVFVTS